MNTMEYVMIPRFIEESREFTRLEERVLAEVYTRVLNEGQPVSFTIGELARSAKSISRTQTRRALRKALRLGYLIKRFDGRFDVVRPEGESR